MFLDIGIGIIIAILTSLVFQVDISIWLLLFSILAALLPDADFLYFYPGKKMNRRFLIFTFTPEKLPKFVKKYGDPNWVRNIYFKWHPIALIELGVFFFAIVVLFVYTQYEN
jgi:hypothetical protein